MGENDLVECLIHDYVVRIDDRQNRTLSFAQKSSACAAGAFVEQWQSDFAICIVLVIDFHRNLDS